MFLATSTKLGGQTRSNRFADVPKRRKRKRHLTATSGRQGRQPALPVGRSRSPGSAKRHHLPQGRRETALCAIGYRPTQRCQGGYGIQSQINMKFA